MRSKRMVVAFPGDGRRLTVYLLSVAVTILTFEVTLTLTAKSPNEVFRRSIEDNCKDFDSAKEGFPNFTCDSNSDQFHKWQRLLRRGSKACPQPSPTCKGRCTSHTSAEIWLDLESDFELNTPCFYEDTTTKHKMLGACTPIPGKKRCVSYSLTSQKRGRCRGKAEKVISYFWCKQNIE